VGTPDSPTTLVTPRQPTCGLRSSAPAPPPPLPTGCPAGRSPVGPAPQTSRREADLKVVCMASQRLEVRRARRRRLLRAAPLRSRHSVDIWHARTQRRAHAAKRVATPVEHIGGAGVAPDTLEGSLARPRTPRSAQITGSARRLLAGHPCATGPALHKGLRRVCTGRCARQPLHKGFDLRRQGACMCQSAGCYSARHGGMVAAQRLLSRFLPSAPLAARRAALPASPLAAQALARPSSWESRARTGGTSSSSRLAAMLARSACPSPGWPRLAGPCVTVCVRASSGLGRRWGKARSGTPLQLLAAHSAVPPGPWGTCRKYIDLHVQAFSSSGLLSSTGLKGLTTAGHQALVHACPGAGACPRSGISLRQ